MWRIILKLEYKKDYNEGLLEFLNKGLSVFHVISNTRKILQTNGYEELFEGEQWNLHEGGKYFVCRNESAVIGFRLSSKSYNGYMIGAAHSDSPTFKIKENPEIIDNGYVKLNVEGHGGMLMSTWLDRPLSVAGRIITRDGNSISTRLVNVDRDLLLIPNVAIHMNRAANSNQSWNGQLDMLPILGDAKFSKDKFMEIVADNGNVRKEDILGHDLYLYIREKASVWGSEKQYISSARLDDLQCAYGDIQGFLESECTVSKNESSVPVIAIFDNEEVGSLTKQGADSTFLSDTLKRIAFSCGKTESDYLAALASSFMVSSDNAHAVHPNHPEKADPVNRPQINKGIVIKFNAAQHYTTDGISCGIFREVCSEVKVPTQVFTNRSDIRGGGTLGNISSSHVSINTVDIGLPQLAMHSAFETAGIKDIEYLVSAMKNFYSKSLRNNGRGSYYLY